MTTLQSHNLVDTNSNYCLLRARNINPARSSGIERTSIHTSDDNHHLVGKTSLNHRSEMIIVSYGELHFSFVHHTIIEVLTQSSNIFGISIVRYGESHFSFELLSSFHGIVSDD